MAANPPTDPEAFDFFTKDPFATSDDIREAFKEKRSFEIEQIVRYCKVERKRIGIWLPEDDVEVVDSFIRNPFMGSAGIHEEFKDRSNEEINQIIEYFKAQQKKHGGKHPEDVEGADPEVVQFDA